MQNSRGMEGFAKCHQASSFCFNHSDFSLKDSESEVFIIMRAISLELSAPFSFSLLLLVVVIVTICAGIALSALYYSNNIMGQFSSSLASPLLKLQTRNPSSSTKQSRKAIDYSNYRGSDKFAGLPLDVIFEIFSRLPADTLLGLRSVSKLWNYLIRDPDFIQFHLTKWMQTPPSRLIRAPQSLLSHDLNSFTLVDGIEEGGWRYSNIKVENLPMDNLKIYGSCNGLICTIQGHKWDPIFICNPIAGETMCLPKSDLADKIIRSSRMASCTIGFGFDKATKKYKVLRLISYCENFRTQMLIEIITLGESSWRKLETPVTNRRWYIGTSPMVFLNGFLYWVGEQIIIVFDISSEKFGIMNSNVPNMGKEGEDFTSGLGIIEGCLALVIEQSASNSDGVKIRPERWRIVGSMATGFSLEQCSYDHSTNIGGLYAWLLLYKNINFHYEAPFMPSLVSLNDITIKGCSAHSKPPKAEWHIP